MDKNKLADKKPNFHTNSLSLASALFALEVEFLSLEKSSIGKATFIFSNDSSTQNLIMDFWNRKLAIEPNALFEAQKFLKSCIYEGTYGTE